MSGSAEGMLAAIRSAVPFPPATPFKAVLLGREAAVDVEPFGAGFPAATVEARAVAFDVLDWWDVMFGADLVVIRGGLFEVSDAKTQYLYRAAADRLSVRGALLVGDRIGPQQLLHHLMWLKHAGFPIVDCFWRVDLQTVVGGFKQRSAEASARPLPAGS